MPTVIRSSGTAATTAGESQYLRSLLDEDWKSRRPASDTHRNVLDFHYAYRSGELTPTDVAKSLLPLISREEKVPSKHSTAFLQVKRDLVLKAAEESTKRYASGTYLSVLDGVPVAVKDEIDLTGYKKTYGSKIDFTRKDDATSCFAQRWLDAGAVIIGKTNMHEFGADTTNNNVNFGTPLNPNNDNYYCGGSSGGSAYTVAAGLTTLCQGNDGGGSIRIPSNYVGVYGLKPSAGRVSSRPSTNLAKSNGVAGPIAANMIDLEVGYRIMAQPDALDPASALFIPPASMSSQASRPKVLGIYRPWFDRADPAVHNACQTAVDYLVSECGYTIIDIDIPLLAEGQSAHAMSILTELAAGVDPADTHKLTPANKVLLSVGRKTTSVDFLQAQRMRNLLMQHLSYLFDQHPGLIIVTPTTPNAGWRIESGALAYGITNANQQLRNMEYVWLANFSKSVMFVHDFVAIALKCIIRWLSSDHISSRLHRPCAGHQGHRQDSHRPNGHGRMVQRRPAHRIRVRPASLKPLHTYVDPTNPFTIRYDCEAYLNDSYPNGRVRPRNWTDILKLAADAKQSL